MDKILRNIFDSVKDYRHGESSEAPAKWICLLVKSEHVYKECIALTSAATQCTQTA